MEFDAAGGHRPFDDQLVRLVLPLFRAQLPARVGLVAHSRHEKSSLATQASILANARRVEKGDSPGCTGGHENCTVGYQPRAATAM
ncbi:hypothetical protein GCM10017567_06230 [Amycolatopsis bullii]|uniref:Uncharacterized protein n=1 Tax=Amycolatopsis bullii TaxID=941987 RepID=A0ABQ3K481_9PSEU|nr:hypothetical protein GCM10017567_06230 [Amycolatopsis bullii]